MQHSGETSLIPIFPLHAVLFPGGPLALRIFETRYLDMVSECLKQESGFGVCLIRDGEEVGKAAQPYDIGTYGTISYWHRRDDGLLGVTVMGERIFRILRTEVRPNQLLMGEVEFLSANQPQATPVPERFTPLVERLRTVIDQLDHPYIHLARHFDDACWVGSRLAELLPIPLEHKQHFLMLDDAVQRLERIAALLETGEFVAGDQ